MDGILTCRLDAILTSILDGILSGILASVLDSINKSWMWEMVFYCIKFILASKRYKICMIKTNYTPLRSMDPRPLINYLIMKQWAVSSPFFGPRKAWVSPLQPTLFKKSFNNGTSWIRYRAGPYIIHLTRPIIFININLFYRKNTYEKRIFLTF